jgi:hypothetical protein
LKFRLGFPTSRLFLERFADVHLASQFKERIDRKNVEGKIKTFARYATEISFLEYKMIKYPPSTLAAGALYLSCKLNLVPSWSEPLERVS